MTSHPAFPKHVEHVVHPLFRPCCRLRRQELHGVRGTLRVHPPPANVVPELELNPGLHSRLAMNVAVGVDNIVDTLVGTVIDWSRSVRDGGIQASGGGVRGWGGGGVRLGQGKVCE